MRYLVLSDIHANIEALDAALAVSAAAGYDRVLLLGDLVGYGASPNEVVARVRTLDVAAAVRGNHDKVAVGLDGAEPFTPLAQLAADWTRRALLPDTLAYLAGLPKGPVMVNAKLEICHGTPFDEDAYVFDGLDAVRALNASRAPLCLIGHTHIPLAVTLANGELSYDDLRGGDVRDVAGGARHLVNVGSVGQPRDGNPDAACAIVDLARERVEFLRVPYDVGAAQARIRVAGLPDALAERLAAGR